ncbi:hypothetical protein ACQP1P_11915 [Dactylosporangium sp. CA-052675]|uniref:hypothetical protein n=1 Tax=Dactylosporangium sp. CA-052675 TaxID=3239927 RepID=UPI003D9312EA
MDHMDLDSGMIESPSLALAVRCLGERHRADPVTVLLAAVALQLAAYTGEDEAALRVPAGGFRLDCAPSRYRHEPVGSLLRRAEVAYEDSRPDGCWFADRRCDSTGAAGVRGAARLSAVVPRDPAPAGARFFLCLLRLGPTAELRLCAAHGFLGRRGPLGFLSDLERVLVRATGTSTTAGLYAAVR